METPAFGKSNSPVLDSQHRDKRSRKQKCADGPSDSIIPKRQRSSEISLRRLWTMTESALVRLEVLERYDQDHAHGERSRPGSPANVSILRKEEANGSLYKILENTLLRISVLEKKRDISYRNAFKASNGTECFIRGCGGDFSRRQNTLQHSRTTPTPERQVAAIILNQTECLECNKSLKTASGLIHHETTVHKEAYNSRIDIFRPFLEQDSHFEGEKNPTQPSKSKPNDPPPNHTIHLGPAVLPPASSDTKNSPPPSGLKAQHLSQTPVYSPQPNRSDKHQQPSVNSYLSKVTSNQDDSQLQSASSTLFSSTKELAEEGRKEYQRARKKRNMRDLRNRRKEKEIASGKRNSEGKLVKSWMRKHFPSDLNSDGEKDVFEECE